MTKTNHKKIEFNANLLSVGEQMNPILAILNFFNSNSLQGHLKALQEWRDCITQDRYYTTRLQGPARLLFIYESNLKLIDAAWHLYLELQSGKSKNSYLIADEEILRLEKETWGEYPTHLNTEQLKNPFLIISNLFFKDYTLNGYHLVLYRWLEHGLSSVGTQTIEKGEFTHIFKNLQKLQEAAFVIHERTADIRHQMQEQARVGNKNIGYSNTTTKQSQIRFNKTLTPNAKIELDRIIKKILIQHPSIRLIIFLGSHTGPFTPYIFILINIKDLTPSEQISQQIEQECKPQNLLAIVAKVGRVHMASMVEPGAIFFYKYALRTGTVIYQPGDFILPGKGFAIKKIDEAKYQSQRNELKAANPLMKDITSYLQSRRFHLAASWLLFSMNVFLFKWLALLTGYFEPDVELPRLLDLTLMFTEDLKKLFIVDQPKDKRLYSILTDTYFIEESDDWRPPNENDIHLLIKKYEQLRRVAIELLDDMKSI
jgi:hypothetical protein